MLKRLILKTAVISFCSLMAMEQAYAGGMEPEENKNSSHKTSKPKQDLSKLNQEELIKLVLKLQTENKELKAITSVMSESEQKMYKLLSTKISDKVQYGIMAREIANQDQISLDEALDKIAKSEIMKAREIANQDQITFDEALDKIAETFPKKSVTLKEMLHDKTIDEDIVREVFRGVINSIEEPKLFNISKHIYLKSPENMEEYILFRLCYGGGVIKPICPKGGLVDSLVEEFCKVRKATCMGTEFEAKDGTHYVNWIF